MEDNFNISNSEPTGPVLTLNPSGISEEIKPVEEEKLETNKPISDYERLSEEEKKQVMEFSKTINLENSQEVLQYGAGAQSKISNFSDDVLKSVSREGKATEVNKDLIQLTTEIKSLDTDDEPETGLKRLFSFTKPVKDKMENYSIKYNNISKNIDLIVDSLEGHQRTLMKDVHILDSMYDNNLIYFKELSMYILAGEEKLKSYKEIDIQNQDQIAKQSSDQIETQKLNDMLNLANRFEKKLHDLKLSRTISLQMAPQIRLIQNNDVQLVEKIQSSILNSIPIWKNNIVLTLTMINSNKALESQKKVTDMTNTLLQKNSEMLKMGSIDVAKANEESIVSIETLQKTNNDLIDTINSVLEIQEEGRKKRYDATKELVRIEEELKENILKNSRNYVEQAKGQGEIIDESK